MNPSLGSTGGTVPSSASASASASSSDPFLADDYYPLAQAHKAILAALRADETSPDADLYRRIASGSATGITISNFGTSTTGASTATTGTGTRAHDQYESVPHGYRSLSSTSNTVPNPTYPLLSTTPTTTPTTTTTAAASSINATHTATTASSPSFFMSPKQQPSQMTSIDPTTNQLTTTKHMPNVHSTLNHATSIPLPPYLTNIIKETKLSSLMGILPDANMVWVSVDDALYLWEYDSSLVVVSSSGGQYGSSSSGSSSSGRYKEDFVCFKVPSGQCVVSVGIVPPKKGMFCHVKKYVCGYKHFIDIDGTILFSFHHGHYSSLFFFCVCCIGVFLEMVEWCLVVTTPEEAILCALAREDVIHPESGMATGDSHLKLIPTRYEIPTDSIPLLSVCGTNDGRIFMGGYDGCLYEMSYEGFVRRKQDQHFGGQYYNDNDFEHDYGTTSNDPYYGLVESISSDIATKGKRVLSAILGPMAPSSNMRARKCRKVNHSSVAPPLVTAVVPGFILRATSAVFGSSATTSGGPIVSLTLDKGRNILYGLTSKGYIHAYDLSSGSSNKSNDIHNLSNTPAKLACSVDVVKSVRRYLDCVSHGRMNPPSTSTDTTIASITFPGGASGAMAGVGGMDGARLILKTADADIMKLKSKSNSTSGKFKSESCIHPISINVVPESESKFLTLVVVAAGGLRYYLSVIPNTGNNLYGNNTNRPGRRFSLCHIRAPPSFMVGDDVTLDKNMDRPSGSSPCMRGLSGDSKAFVSRGFYLSGMTMLVIENANAKSEERAGDSILSMTPDYTKDLSLADSTVANPPNKSFASYADSTSSGIKEIASQPMVPNNIASPTASVLLGGHVWELNARSLSVSERDPILTLFYHSTTPTTYSQNENILNPYLPASNKRKDVSFQKHLHTFSNSALETATTSSRALQSYGGTLTAFFKALILGKSMQLTGPLAKSFTTHASNYFISNNFGCNPNGFSSSTSTSSKGNKAVKPVAGQSARLPPSLLYPSAVPLSELAIQHLLINSKRKGIFALNSGGLHYFNQVQPIEKLQSLLLSSKASSMGRDESLKDFFKIYGYSEGCSMALSIAVCSGSSDILIERAIQAALSFALRPSMTRLNQSNMNISNASLSTVDTVPGFDGFVFKSSSLYDGLLSLVSRLLRPIWCKPAIVVTESKMISSRKRGARPTIVPAKVELLLDEASLEQIKRPLANLQHLMREKFAPAILSVPGTNIDDVDMTDISETTDVMTKSIQFQTQVTNQSNAKVNFPKERDLRNAARLHEDRNMHALYRLLSRTVQLLQLVSYLHGAHVTPELPEVEFGLLHGLTYSQLVTLKASQDRIEAVLTDLFSRDSTMTSFGRDTICSESVSTVESENLSNLLYRNCYLYFSIGSRLSFLGFKNAYAAMSQSSLSRRNELISSASTYFRQASKHWSSLVHVTGRLSDSLAQSSESLASSNTFQYFNDIANKAIENGSPLARAAIVLLELNDVVGIVDICLECSRNFYSHRDRKYGDTDVVEEQAAPILSWEKSLYHRHLPEDADAQISDSVHIQHSDIIAKKTCYALLCYHIHKLLESTAEVSPNKQLVDRMLSVVISSQNMDFISELFDYLSASNHVDTFLRIDSVALENWLKEHDSESSLLWRYYTIHNIHWMAGEVAWNRGACDESMSLSDRLEFLTRALNSYTIAQRELGADSNLLQRRRNIPSIGYSESISLMYASATPSREDLSRCISQVGEQIDIAKLQSRILAQILHSQNADKINKDQLTVLETKLVNVSDLYNVFACPLAMYDVCLVIIQTCKYNDEATVLKLWKSIICEEILPCRTENSEVLSFLTQFKENSLLEEEEVVLSSSTVRTVTGEILKCFDDGDWKTGLISRVTGLGRELLREGSQSVFPIQHISDWLENIDRVYCATSGTKHDEWVLKTLVNCGASFSSIVQAYDSNLNALGDSSLRLLQLLNLAKILQMWLDRSLQSRQSPNSDSISTSSNMADLTRYTTAILNQIDEYRASLESMVTASTDDTAKVSDMFNEIEKELRKLL